MIEIIDEHIKKAEELFIDGNSFDALERIPFIKNLNTCDLLAVPGSGKTTALLAKLYCIAQNMPFEDGSGIMVLAHTNHAVEEIERKLKKNCPQLFDYPNFVGTIQSFTNRFLANQACFKNFGSYIKKNDDDLYESEVKKFFYAELKWDSEANPNNEKRLKNKLYGKANYQRNGTTKEKVNNTLSFIKDLEFDILNKKFVFGSKKTTLYKLGGAADNYYMELQAWKESLYKMGLLSYKDSFQLANYFISTNDQLKLILQKRFKYVFIDEMQDLEKLQIDLIDNIFYSESSQTVIQRIGDINQSIYNSGKNIKDNCDGYREIKST